MIRDRFMILMRPQQAAFSTTPGSIGPKIWPNGLPASAVGCWPSPGSFLSWHSRSSRSGAARRRWGRAAGHATTIQVLGQCRASPVGAAGLALLHSAGCCGSGLAGLQNGCVRIQHDFVGRSLSRPSGGDRIKSNGQSAERTYKADAKRPLSSPLRCVHPAIIDAGRSFVSSS